MDVVLGANAGNPGVSSLSFVVKLIDNHFKRILRCHESAETLKKAMITLNTVRGNCIIIVSITQSKKISATFARERALISHSDFLTDEDEEEVIDGKENESSEKKPFNKQCLLRWTLSD
ncbi:hypothetical protein J6590_007545 [Homalodisca vitripennis]|nr:hypothetical protein J6590_007545 [Homalodisca vitripennis]